ncbi:Neuronal calcium sensor 2 [Lepeophtheirus salmonis]|uniref:Neuronal calcium sensor 2 n=1 Tax=Lepeophtheirus salmonis TaxID=72036 RepID=A0A7R8H964_LEPSM|nr:Neuronal calcium sensor 2 [Lepeophtheirus salmonis]CAF2935905.1 Neuronal calcium sensor 2 [Lepeophtheirus salmonis]
MQPLEPLTSSKPKRGVKFKEKKTSDTNLDKIDEESREENPRPFHRNGILLDLQLEKNNSKPLHRPFETILKNVSEPVTGGIGRRLYEKDEIFSLRKYGDEVGHKKPKSLREVQRHPQAFGIWDRVFDLSVIDTLPPIRKDHIVKPVTEEIPEDEKIPEYEGYVDIVRLRDNHDESKCYLSPQEFDWCLEHTNFDGNDVIAWYKRFRKDCPHGLLSKAHLIRLFKQMIPLGNGDAFVNHIFRIFDNDNNGHLDFMEFLMAMDMTKCESPEERLKWAFKMYDVDGNGEIDLKELTTIIDIVDQLEGHKGGYKNSKKKAKEIYDLMDLNHDGSVSLEEFLKYSALIDSVRNQTQAAK